MIHEEKQCITVAKFGCGVIGEYGQRIPSIRRIKEIRTADGIGPVAVFSAPKGLTDKIIEIGKKSTESSLLNVDELPTTPYRKYQTTIFTSPLRKASRTN